MRETRVGEGIHRLYRGSGEAVREAGRELEFWKNVLVNSHSAVNNALYRRTYLVWAVTNLCYICMLVMIYRYMLGATFQREINLVGWGKFTGDVHGKVHERGRSGSRFLDLNGKVTGDARFDRSLLQPSRKWVNALGNLSGEVQGYVDGGDFAGRVGGSITGDLLGKVHFQRNLLGLESARDSRNKVTRDNDGEFTGDLVANDFRGTVTDIETGMVVGEVAGRVSGLVSGHATGEVQGTETMLAWFIEVFRSTTLIFVVSILFICMPISYDWALSLAKAYNYSSTIAAATLIAVSCAFFFAFALLDTLDIDFAYYPITVLLCMVATLKFAWNYFQTSANQIALPPATSNIAFEYKKIILDIHPMGGYQIPFALVFGECLQVCGLSLFLITALRMLPQLIDLTKYLLSLALKYFTYPVIERVLTIPFHHILEFLKYIIQLLQIGSTSHFYYIYLSMISTFFIFSVARVGTETLKLLILYPIDFVKLKAKSDEGGGGPAHEFLVRAITQRHIHDLPKPSDEDPRWRTYVLAQQYESDSMLKDTVRHEWSGCYKLNYLLCNNSSMWNIISRLLAWQDFVRCMKMGPYERTELFRDGWEEIVFEAATLLNAITLQLQLNIAHAIVEVFPSNRAPNPRQRGPLLPRGPLCRNWNGNINWAALEYAEKDKEKRTNSRFGRVINWLFGVPLVGPIIRRLVGSVVQEAPIPRAMVQAAIYASEGVTMGMLDALREDPSGVSYNYVPMLVSSHLALNIAIKDYHDMMLKSAHVPGGVEYHGPTRRVASKELVALANALDASLNRLFVGYSDVIPSFAFPQAYAEEIEARLVSAGR